ncbi:hypothetical protein BKA64DRAFT_646621 [Cadophora sp. MPI-SDFR-AT-0126]|nr:hypothetical protein BKA64DRAFT_646621 [Leotiomycetes sp. MPI-SDFR-AT-0126]
MHQESHSASANGPSPAYRAQSLAGEVTKLVSPPYLSDELMHQESPSSSHLADCLPGHHETVSIVHGKSGANYTLETGASGTVIIIDDSEDDLAIGTPSYIRKIVGSNILDDGTGSDYGDEGVDDLQQRSFIRVSRRRGRMNQLRDTQVGVTITACTLFLIAECCTQGRNSQRK